MGAKGKKGGGKKGGARPKMTYKVVQQSYEDPEFENEPKPVLVPTAVLEKQFQHKKKPMVEFVDNLPEDYSNKRNMTMQEDEAPEGIFDDEVEEDFDQDWIHQMMEEPEGEEEEEWDEGDEEDPVEKRRAESKHKKEEYGSNERMFERMMKDFNNDEDIEEDDPRVQGPLPVESYAEALMQFAEENAGTTWMDEGDAHRHRGFINQLKKMSRDNNIFDSNGNGLFYALLPDKGARMQKAFREEHKELIELTKKQLDAGEIDTEDVLYKPDSEIRKADGTEVVTMKQNKWDRMDCETVLSTYSTLYNRPNVIAAEKGKIKLPHGAAAIKKRARGFASGDDLQAQEDAAKIAESKKKKQQQRQEEEAAAAAAAEEEEEEEKPNFEEIRYDLSMPSKNETKEEKAARRKLVKQLQAERRQEKKALKGAYGTVSKQEVVSRKTSKAAKQTCPLSLVSGAVTK